MATFVVGRFVIIHNVFKQHLFKPQIILQPVVTSPYQYSVT
jgi:hypothetical protein